MVEIEKFLKMSARDFDQSPNGWRIFGEHGREKEAIDLIENYLLENKDDLGASVSSIYFHLGQLYAHIGNYSEAIRVMKEAIGYTDLSVKQIYIEATIAYLQGDISILKRKYEEYVTSAEGGWEDNIPVIVRLIKALEQGEKQYNKVY